MAKIKGQKGQIAIYKTCT